MYIVSTQLFWNFSFLQLVGESPSFIMTWTYVNVQSWRIVMLFNHRFASTRWTYRYSRNVTYWMNAFQVGAQCWQERKNGSKSEFRIQSSESDFSHHHHKLYEGESLLDGQDRTITQKLKHYFQEIFEMNLVKTGDANASFRTESYAVLNICSWLSNNLDNLTLY